MAKDKYDFSGWATKNNIRCSDGRVIAKDAFIENDGRTVPLVWNHDHKAMDNVIGHALLENREEGVYAYCSLNNTRMGQTAKELIQHGDIRALSIYANQLKHKDGNVVVHGSIAEVSLVLAGANKGAFIDTIIAHSDSDEEEAIIYHSYSENDLELAKEDELVHEDQPAEQPAEQPKEETIDDILKTFTDEQKDVLYFLVGKALESNGATPEEVQHSEEEVIEHSDTNIKEVLDTYNDKQKEVLYFLVGEALSKAGESTEVQHSEEEIQEDKDNLNHTDENMEETNMKTNLFENSVKADNTELMHSAFEKINADAKRNGSVRDAYYNYLKSNEADTELVHSLESALAHSITNVGDLFPEYRAVSGPETVGRDFSWVSKVMNGVHHTPFARVKSSYITITADEARAKGYVKGHQKVEEVVAALKRTTPPTTIYKLQKMDRDDVIDITEFDVVAWLKQEMRTLLDEEIARAILIGDGRSVDSDDKINEQCIRPIYKDSNVYTVKVAVEYEQDDDPYSFAKKVIRAAKQNRKFYKGSGNPTFFCTQDAQTDMLLIEDTNGRVIYDTNEKLATALMAKEVVPVEVMANQTRTADGYSYELIGIMVNLTDYNVGADKGGQVNMFDDFDINYNKYEYLIETRCSGALVKPYSAIIFEKKTKVNG